MVADAVEVADALVVVIGLLRRRLGQTPVPGELSLPQRAALSRLDRSGPMTSAALARLEQVSPQSMGATLAGLEQEGLLARRPDPDDGRQVVLSLTPRGAQVVSERRSARVQQLAAVLDAEFTPDELARLGDAAGLLERLADRL